MRISEAIQRLEQAGFRLGVENGRIWVVPGSRLTEAQRQWIKAHRDELIAELQHRHRLSRVATIQSAFGVVFSMEGQRLSIRSLLPLDAETSAFLEDAAPAIVQAIRERAIVEEAWQEPAGKELLPWGYAWTLAEAYSDGVASFRPRGNSIRVRRPLVARYPDENEPYVQALCSLRAKQRHFLRLLRIVGEAPYGIGSFTNNHEIVWTLDFGFGRFWGWREER